MSSNGARPSLLQILLVFLKVGALSFGGPYAILAYIEKETVERRGWLSADDFSRGIGIGHLTPGPIAFSSAVYAGHRLRGLSGALLAALGLLTPSFLLAVAFAIWYERFAGVPAVDPLLSGFSAAVVGLLLAIVFKMARGLVSRPAAVAIAAAAFALLLLRVNPALVVILAAGSGVLLGAKIDGKAKATR